MKNKMHMKCNSNLKNMGWNMMGRKWGRLCTVVKGTMVFAYSFTLRALTKFFSQKPQTTFSIIKVASPSLWPKGDRLNGQHHRPACASLLVTLPLSTCWGSWVLQSQLQRRVPVGFTGLTKPMADSSVWSPRGSTTLPGFILAHHGTTCLHLLFSLYIYAYFSAK